MDRTTAFFCRAAAHSLSHSALALAEPINHIGFISKKRLWVLGEDTWFRTIASSHLKPRTRSKKKGGISMKANEFAVFFCLLLSLSLPPASASTEETKPQEIKTEQKWAQAEETWGVQPKTIRLTGAGQFLDFRYKIIDPEKAAPVVDRKNKAYLLDQESGKVLPVPVTKIGPMRATTREAKQNREYFVLFGNVNKEIKKGDKVTVVIGEFRAENMVVE
jgi:hypothetical protein